jgi:ubiquinone/menaquinone biosynthesis C-methylase UbiE
MSYPAKFYEDLMVPGLFAPWSSHLIQIANPQPGERVLDVACGTGIVARQIAPRVGPQGNVSGLDLDPDKIDVARVTAKREGFAIEWKTGPAEQLPFPDGRFDLVLCQFGLMFFSDRHTALTEMRRILKTGGRVVLSVWQELARHPFYQMLDGLSQRHLGKSSVGAVFSLGDTDEVRKLLTDAGFRDIEIESMSITARYSNPQEFLAWEIDVDPAETPALQNLDAEAQKAILVSLHEEMQEPLQAVIKDDEVVMPSHAHIARARR